MNLIEALLPSADLLGRRKFSSSGCRCSCFQNHSRRLRRPWMDATIACLNSTNPIPGLLGGPSASQRGRFLEGGAMRGLRGSPFRKQPRRPTAQIGDSDSECDRRGEPTQALSARSRMFGGLPDEKDCIGTSRRDARSKAGIMRLGF